MSQKLELASMVPGQPLIYAAPLVVIVLSLAVITMGIRRQRRKVHESWAAAGEELGLELAPSGSKHGPIARGTVNEHAVTMAPVARTRRKNALKTQYSVKFEAPEAPTFQLSQRTDASTVPVLDTGNPKFDAVVAIRTERPDLLCRFLTPSRRAAILRMLTYWPTTIVTDRAAHITTTGIEDDPEKLVDSICHLVASAETFDRPTPGFNDEDETSGGSGSGGAGASGEDEANGRGGHVLTEVRLDEVSVLNDLFNSDLDTDDIRSRFEHTYQGREVNWSGEVIRVTEPDESGRQRMASLIGSADGQTTDSGRVVAVTTVWAEPAVTEGDIVSFGGILANLEVAQRLFNLV